MRTLLLVAAALYAAGAAAAPPADTSPIESLVLDTPAQALARDALSYSTAFGVDEAEAMRRLTLQQASIPQVEKLRLRFADRLAGLAIEHLPTYRLVVLLKGETAPVALSLPVGGERLPVTIVGGAAATRAEVLRAIDTHRAAIARAIPGTRGIGHDPRTGHMLIFQRATAATRPVAEVEAELSALTGVPVTLRRLAATFENASAAGGSRVEGPVGGRHFVCTTGFLVERGVERGVTTAAHCPDAMTYRGPDGEERALHFEGGWGTAYRDIQIHSGGGEGPAILFSDTGRTAARSVTGWVTRPMTRAGDWVCKRGESSGGSCAEVELTDFAPPGELCGGLCSTSWVSVKGPQCRRGDSGAPVFIGTTALGVLKGGAFLAGGSCAFYYYMSVDYLPEGWRVATTRN